MWHDKTMQETAAALAHGETTSAALTALFLDRIREKDEALGSYLVVAREQALAQADESDRRRQEGRTLGPLDGLPIALKDLFITAGLPSRAASKILDGFVPPYDGTHAQRLKNAGTVLLGKLNMDEFAMGGANTFSGYKPCKNPWDTTRTPGGSSGGSACAVAAGLCLGALGSDTGGSIRQPAAFCGIVGMKPSYGRVTRSGMIAFASSLDQAGPMTRSVYDAALLLNVIAGHDPLDSTVSPLPVPDYTAFCGKDVKGLRIGLPAEYFGDGLDPEVRASVMEAAAAFESLGASLHEIRLPLSPYAVATYYILATAEASSNLARYDGVRYGRRADAAADLKDLYFRSRSEGFGPEVKRRIMLGTYVLSAGYYDAYYAKAQKARTLFIRDFANAFAQVDAILTPTTPTPAFGLDEKMDDPLQMYLMDIYTISANLAGLPAISLPCGFTGQGLPVGVQLMTPAFEEGRLFSLGHAYEQAAGWRDRHRQEV